MSEIKPYKMDKQKVIDILWAEIGNNQQPLHCTRKELCDAVEIAEESIGRAEPSGKAEQLNKPLTLSEVKEHLSKRHPHEIEPLYVVFDPPMPINYAPRWRDAYNLLGMVEVAADDYGKTWVAYRQRPESEDDEPVDLEAIK